VATDQKNRYTRVAMALHWLMAILIFALFAIGWHMVDLPRGPDRSANFALHKSIGLTVLLLAAVRIGWRFFHRPPPHNSLVPAWRVTAARSTHLLFYVLLFLQPTSGYLSSSFSGYETKVFGVPLPQWGWLDSPLNELFTEIHVMSSVLFVVFIGIHICGALSHGLSRNDGVLRRIIPW
jgi:cytochrome b561